MNKYTPPTSEEFRRIQYVSVKDSTSPLCIRGRVYPVYAWHIDDQNRLTGVTVSPNSGLDLVPLSVGQCNLFLSSDKQVLKVTKHKE